MNNLIDITKPSEAQLKTIKVLRKRFYFEIINGIDKLTKYECHLIISTYYKDGFLLIRGGFIYGTKIKAKNISTIWKSGRSIWQSGDGDFNFIDDTDKGTWLDENNSPWREKEIPFINPNNKKISRY